MYDGRAPGAVSGCIPARKPISGTYRERPTIRVGEGGRLVRALQGPGGDRARHHDGCRSHPPEGRDRLTEPVNAVHEWHRSEPRQRSGHRA
jgi:hypothetical protein